MAEDKEPTSWYLFALFFVLFSFALRATHSPLEGWAANCGPGLIQISPLGHRLHFVWGRGVALERAAKPEFAMMICLRGHLGTAFKTAGFLDIAHFLY